MGDCANILGSYQSQEMCDMVRVCAWSLELLYVAIKVEPRLR